MLNNTGKTQGIINKNLENLSASDYAEMISNGEVETSAFDGKPTFNCEQRW